MSTTTTRIRRHGAALFAIGAVAALAAGCSGGPAPASSAADQDGAGTAAQAPDAPAEAPADAPADVHAVADSGDQNDQGDQDDQSDGSDEASPAPSPVELPSGWAGTLSTETLTTTGAVSYLAMQHFNTGPAVTTRSAEQMENGEFLAGSDPQCDGDAVLDGEVASCTFTAADGATVYALVHMVPTGFGNTALLYEVTDQSMPDYTVAPGAQLGLQAIEGDIAGVTDEDLAGAAMSAVMMGDRNDGEVPPELAITCEVTDGGEHGLCEVAGTPDGGGDGAWYATAQNGYDGDRAAYLFTRLPQG